MDLEPSIVSPLRSSGQFIDATYVRRPHDHPVKGLAVVVNPNPSPVYLAESPQALVPPFSSTVLVDSQIAAADSVLIFRVTDQAGIAGIVHEPGWSLLGDQLAGDGDVTGGKPFPLDTPLWRGPQDDLGSIRLDPAAAIGEPGSGEVLPFDVKVNLWFAPAGTDCFIHNQHDFLETHTQISGSGRMQKFSRQDHDAIYEDVQMVPGRMHSPFCRIGDDGGFLYPWHQYHADSACVWLAVEYHATSA
jgi:hypothetical protein